MTRSASGDGCQPFLLEPGEDEAVDLVSDFGFRVSDFRHRGFPRCLKGPVLLRVRLAGAKRNSDDDTDQMRVGW